MCWFVAWRHGLLHLGDESAGPASIGYHNTAMFCPGYGYMEHASFFFHIVGEPMWELTFVGPRNYHHGPFSTLNSMNRR